MTLRLTKEPATSFAPRALKLAHHGEHAERHHIRLVDHPLVHSGRIELLPLLREQSIRETLHRLGNVLPKPAQVSGPRSSGV